MKEYKFVTIQNKSDSEVEATMNTMAKEGWEVLCTNSYFLGVKTLCITFVRNK